MSITNHSDYWPNTNIISDKKQKILDGYLHKRGKFNTGYQERWFVLHSNNSLSYYQNSSSAQSTPLGEISLYSVTDIKEEQDNVFHLITSKRTFILRCDIKSDYNKWLQKIKHRVTPNLLCQNWLYKKGEKNRLWKSRYFLLCEYEMKYEIRYYDDEHCKKYKGKINCIDIDDIALLSPKESKKKYSKENVLEIITGSRTYVIAAKDKPSIDSWHKILSKILFGDDFDDNPFDINLTEAELVKIRQTAIKESPINEWDTQTVLVWLDTLSLDATVNTDLKTIIRVQNINGYSLHEIRNKKQMKDLLQATHAYKHYAVDDAVCVYLYNAVNSVRNTYTQRVENQIESNLFGAFSMNNTATNTNAFTRNTAWGQQEGISTDRGFISNNNGAVKNFKQRPRCVQCNKVTVFGGINEENGFYCHECWEKSFGETKDNVNRHNNFGGATLGNTDDLWSLHEEIDKLKQQLIAEKAVVQQAHTNKMDMERKMNDTNAKLRSEKSNCQRLRNELNETKQLLQKEKTKTNRLQKKMKEMSAAKSRKIHKKGDKTGWKRKKIDKWSNGDILHWINSMNLENKWNNKLFQEIKNCECTGKDIVYLKSAEEVGESFDIAENQSLCNILCRKIKNLKKQNGTSSKPMNNKFKINIFSQGKDITLNGMVAKTVRVRDVKKLYKRQSGVAATLDDIHFYCKMKLLQDWKTLEQVHIVDDKHLITVKFGADSADTNSSSNSMSSAPKCICGRYLQRMRASVCYRGSGVLCNKCYGGIKGNEFVYHCNANKIAAHESGYDLCDKCSKLKKKNQNSLDFLFTDNTNQNGGDDWAIF